MVSFKGNTTRIFIRVYLDGQTVDQSDIEQVLSPQAVQRIIVEVEKYFETHEEKSEIPVYLIGDPEEGACLLIDVDPQTDTLNLERDQIIPIYPVKRPGVPNASASVSMELEELREMIRQEAVESEKRDRIIADMIHDSAANRLARAAIKVFTTLVFIGLVFTIGFMLRNVILWILIGVFGFLILRNLIVFTICLIQPNENAKRSRWLHVIFCPVCAGSMVRFWVNDTIGGIKTRNNQLRYKILSGQLKGRFWNFVRDRMTATPAKNK